MKQIKHDEDELFGLMQKDEDEFLRYLIGFGIAHANDNLDNFDESDTMVIEHFKWLLSTYSQRKSNGESELLK